ncbi:MAG: hypothetical protein WCG83_00895 [Candidatus Peregrinibacteria bacterium]
MTAVFAILYFGTLALFGFLLAISILKVRDLFGIIGFSFLAGPAFVMVVSNALGYVLPITRSFVVTYLLVLLLCAIILLRGWGSFRRLSTTLEIPPRKALLLIIGVFLLVALAYARDRGSDEWTPPHFALPALIVAGDFPVREPDIPWERTGYHYGSALLVANSTFMTGLTLAQSQSFLPPIATAGILFFAGALAWRLRRSWGAAVLAAVMSLAAAGLFWLNGFFLVRDLFDYYIRGIAIVYSISPSPFQWLTPMLRNMHAQPLLMELGQRNISVGGAYFFGLLYSLQHVLDSPREKSVFLWIASAIVLGAALAITMETSLVVLLACLLSFTAIVFLLRRRDTMGFLLICAAFGLPVLFIAITQGGPLTQLQGATGSGAFAWNLTGAINTSNTASIALGSLLFFRDYGPHILLFLLAICFFWRKKNISIFPLLLGMIAIVHFLIPLVFSYPWMEGQLLRFFYIFFSLSSLLIALFLWDTFFAIQRLRKFGVIIVTLLLIAGTLNATVRLVFPTLRLEYTEFFPSMPKVALAQENMYFWIRNHTTLEDYFFVSTWQDENKKMEHDRLSLMFSTGRFALGFGSISDPAPEKEAFLRSANEHCSSDSLEALGVRYLVVPTERQSTWFKQECDSTLWRPVYRGGEEYPIVYENSAVGYDNGGEISFPQ